MNAINTLETPSRSSKLEEGDISRFDVLQFIELNKNSVAYILKIEEEMNSIIYYCEKFPLIFIEFTKKYNLNKNSKFSYKLYYQIKKDFLEVLYENTNIGVEYQNILSPDCEIVFNEGLLRIKSNKEEINHFDFLELNKSLGAGINTFYMIAEKIFSDINAGIVKSPISINAEVSDILNKNFIDIILFLAKKYSVNLKGELIIIEVLENETIPNTPEFKERIQRLKSIGIKIAFDDIETNVDVIKETIKNIIQLDNNVDILKLDGKSIQAIYKIYKDNKKELTNIIKNIIYEIKNLYKKGIKIVAEWVENLEIYDFVKNVLGINLYQGFYSRNNENLKIIKNDKI
ncbi:MAG: EAL domain-containing protein [Candidatus Gracilibacteria bacterium]|nr:EAL domain-containing protein [Candidatus Gracilibacteria bacterium]